MQCNKLTCVPFFMCSAYTSHNWCVCVFNQHIIIPAKHRVHVDCNFMTKTISCLTTGSASVFLTAVLSLLQVRGKMSSFQSFSSFAVVRQSSARWWRTQVNNMGSVDRMLAVEGAVLLPTILSTSTAWNTAEQKVIIQLLVCVLPICCDILCMSFLYIYLSWPLCWFL